jgi:phosphocarrier protein
MYSRTVLIQNSTGLHARPASEFVACAKQFKSKISIRNVTEEDDVDAKSIMMLLTLGLAQGEEVEISARGEDEVEAVDKLVALVESKFSEQ